MPPPRVAILLPLRNAGPWLDACLRSVRRQTYGDFTCLVVDDGSRDDGPAIAARHAAADPRIALAQARGVGLVAALQTGLDQCASPLVARMDADDLMHRRRLELQVQAMDRDPGLDGLGCHAWAFAADRSAPLGDGTREYMRWLRSLRLEADVRRDAFVDAPLLHPTWLMRTELLRAHGYRDEGWAEDYDLLLRLLQRGARLAVLPKVLHAWRRSHRAATFADPRYAEARRVALKASALAAGFLHGHERYLLWGYGHTGKRLRAALQAHGKRPAAIVELHPRRLGMSAHGARFVPPAALQDAPRLPIVVCVAGLEARAQARARLAGLGRQELVDFVCAA